MYQWEWEVCWGESPGLSWALAGCILSVVNVWGSELPAGSGSLAEAASEIRHGSVLLVPGLFVGVRAPGQRICRMSQSFIVPLGSPPHLLALSHVISPGPSRRLALGEELSMLSHLWLCSAPTMTPYSKRALILPFIPQTRCDWCRQTLSKCAHGKPGALLSLASWVRQGRNYLPVTGRRPGRAVVEADTTGSPCPVPFPTPLLLVPCLPALHDRRWREP